MSRVVSVISAVLTALAVGSLATAAWAQETSPSQTPSASPSPSGSPSATPTPTPSESPKPSPTPRPSATVTPGPPTPSPSGGANGEGTQGEITLEVDPSTTALRVGERMTVEVDVANGMDTAKNLTLSVELPGELGYLGSIPQGQIVAGTPDGGHAVAVQLGTVEPGATETVVLELEAVSVGTGQIDLGVSGDATSSPESLVIDVVANDEKVAGALKLEAAAPSTPLALLGDRLVYRLTVTNTSDAPLEDVIVVERVAPEIHVLAAPLVEGVDAVQIGRFLEKEDIVWVMDRLDPGEKVNLPWRGEVQKTGDLEVRTSARVTARRAEPATASAANFLAAPGAAEDTVNPPFAPIVKRVAITVPAELPAPGTLPVTGMAAWMWAVIGAAIVLAGLTFYRFGSPQARGKRLPAAVLLVSIMAAACVSSEPQQQPRAVGTPEVKGQRIERGDDQESDPSEESEDRDNGGAQGDEEQEPAEDQGDDADPVEPDSDPVPGDEPPVVDTDPVEPPTGGTETRIVVREVTLDDLPVTDAPTTSGSSGSFAWNEASRSIEGGTSSLFAQDDNVVSVVTTIRDDGDSISADVTLMNPSDDERLAIKGHLVHEVGEDGQLARLTSDPIDTVLSPGGRVTATFRYLLPSGTYQVGGSFFAT